MTLNNGVEIPQLGFGVFQVSDAKPTAAVSTAGYRSIDTAAVHGNEAAGPRPVPGVLAGHREACGRRADPRGRCLQFPARPSAPAAGGRCAGAGRQPDRTAPRHPGLLQRELRALHGHLGIATEAWSPLARGAVPAEPALTEIAERHGKSPAQVVLRRHLQLGDAVIPRSVTAARIRENMDVFDFDLGDEETAAIAALDRRLRTGADPDTLN